MLTPDWTAAALAAYAMYRGQPKPAHGSSLTGCEYCGRRDQDPKHKSCDGCGAPKPFVTGVLGLSRGLSWASLSFKGSYRTNLDTGQTFAQGDNEQPIVYVSTTRR